MFKFILIAILFNSPAFAGQIQALVNFDSSASESEQIASEQTATDSGVAELSTASYPKEGSSCQTGVVGPAGSIVLVEYVGGDGNWHTDYVCRRCDRTGCLSVVKATE